MSYSLDVNLLLYASDSESPQHARARAFLMERPADPDLFCVSWLTLMAYQRMATHPGIFASPLSPPKAWANIQALLSLPRVHVIGEESSFALDYTAATRAFSVRGNLVPDAHLAVILREHGVKRLYTTDVDFRKFDFLEVVNPLMN
ncbi:MAG TPA: TA system VapC family ribonuclease toxin [Terriglobia bacterium]|nr:TA system VapC family ribonuclease toxin [Terriglobia bacterium]